MATEKELEQLDGYLANRLSAQEKADFEQKLAGDPNLKNEFDFQQRIIEGVRSSRLAELKSMLNNVPLSAIEPEETSLLYKAAAGVVIAGLLGTGLYFVLTNDKAINQTPTTKNEFTEASSVDTTETSYGKESEAEVTQEIPSEKSDGKVAIKLAKKKIDTSKVADEIVTEKRKIEVFDPTADMDGNSQQNNSEVETGSAITISTIAVETDDTNKKYTFHYQFKEGKLFLYGSFEKNLYEILEFVDHSKHAVFLLYKDNYYLMDEDVQKVELLTPITDAVLLKKLKEHAGS